ncbi:MAG: Uncharacterized protein AUK63_1245 [bacterium P3]|nr:MAG: Uncharacterized protein AUK63_1245 [bacterium P3]KWW40521.1 MAG: Uncharacterized protein F083_1590 [bacterium F083]
MTVDVAKWNEVSESERKRTNYLNKKGISKKVALIEDAITDMRRHHRLTKENLDKSIEDIVLADKREALKRVEELGKEAEDKKKHNVKNFVVEHIKKIERGKVRTAKKEKYAKESIKNWQQFRRVFLDFYKIRPFKWEDINESLADSFISYLECLGYMKYTLDKHISLFKTIVGVAERQGLHTNHIACSVLKSPRITEDDKAKKIYLTKEELKALYDMPLNGFEEQVRDVFLIGCFTAMRYSDYSRIKKDNIGYTHSGTKVIRIKQEKTAGTVVIPIMDEKLETLLKKYDYNVPEVLDQSLNRTIKDICRKLSETVPSLGKKERTVLTLKERRAEVEAKKKGVVLYEYDEQGYPIRPRWELVASHTARRSCITNMYLSKKFTVPQMMSVSGHKTETMFYKYVKLSLDEYADSVASAAVDGLF